MVTLTTTKDISGRVPELNGLKLDIFKSKKNKKNIWHFLRIKRLHLKNFH